MYREKRILAIVPARGGSKGVKLKNLREVGGTSLVGLVGKVLAKLDYIDKKVASTDHSEISNEAQKYNIEVPFLRPEDISGDRISDLKVLTHALIESEKIYETQFDIILMLQPTSPFRKPEHITSCVKKLIEGNFSSVWTVSETDSKGHPLKQLIFEGDSLEYYDKENGPKIIARQQLKPTYHRNGVCYAISRECLIEQKSIRGENPSYILIEDEMVNIDTELDLKLANFFFEQMSF